MRRLLAIWAVFTILFSVLLVLWLMAEWRIVHAQHAGAGPPSWVTDPALTFNQYSFTVDGRSGVSGGSAYYLVKLEGDKRTAEQCKVVSNSSGGRVTYTGLSPLTDYAISRLVSPCLTNLPVAGSFVATWSFTTPADPDAPPTPTPAPQAIWDVEVEDGVAVADVVRLGDAVLLFRYQLDVQQLGVAISRPAQWLVLDGDAIVGSGTVTAYYDAKTRCVGDACLTTPVGDGPGIVVVYLGDKAQVGTIDGVAVVTGGGAVTREPLKASLDGSGVGRLNELLLEELRGVGQAWGYPLVEGGVVTREGGGYVHLLGAWLLDVPMDLWGEVVGREVGGQGYVVEDDGSWASLALLPWGWSGRFVATMLGVGALFAAVGYFAWNGDRPGGVQLAVVGFLPLLIAGGWIPAGPALAVWWCGAAGAAWILWRGQW